MTSFYVRIVLAYILVLQTFLNNRCSCQNSTDFSSISTAEYNHTPSTSNLSITEVTANENVDNATVVMETTSIVLLEGTMSQAEITSHAEVTIQSDVTPGMTQQDQMTSQNGMTTQDGMTSLEGMTSQNETTTQYVTTDSNPSYTTEVPLEPSPTPNLAYTTGYMLETLIITEDYYVTSLKPVTPELQPSQSVDVTSFITEQFESSKTDDVKSTANFDVSSIMPNMQTSSPLLPVATTLLDIPASSVMITPSSASIVVSTESPTVKPISQREATTRSTPVGPTKAVKDTFKFTMKMDGNCDDAKRDEFKFKQACKSAITERTGVSNDQVVINEIRCGSIVLDFTFYDETGDDKGIEMMEMASEEEPLIIRFNDVEYVVVDVEAAVATTESSGGLSIEDQRLLIYIVAGGLCGIVVILAIGVCLSQSCRNRLKKRNKDISFQNEHLTKLSDINLTTTIIPRPKSIYAGVGDYETRCSLFAITNNYYYYNNGAFMYDDETQANGDITSSDGEGVMVAVEVNEPTTPGAKASEQFGMSSIPEWKLPQLEGVVRAGDEIEASDTASIHEFIRPSSRTFSVPFPPPPPPLPVDKHDPTVTDIILPVPQLNRQSDAFSEITDSSGDTNVLLKSGSWRKELLGLDNVGLELDESKTVSTDGRQDNTLTRKAPGSQLESYEALSRL